MDQPFVSRVPSLEAEVRHWLKNWPADTGKALSKRALAPDVDTVYPALLELYTYEVLRKRFSEVLYEPDLPGSTRRPEFRASRNGISLAVECKVVVDREPIRFAARELERLAKCLNGVKSRYGISIQPQGLLPGHVTPRKVEAFLKRELPKLPDDHGPDEMLVYQESPGSMPINFLIMGPKAGEDEDTIESWWPTGETAQRITTDERIRLSFDEKATRYGVLREPFLIVIWPKTGFPPQEPTILNALYGDLQVFSHQPRRARLENACP